MQNLIKRFSIIHRKSGIQLDKRLKALDIPYGQFMYILCVCEQEGLSQEQLATVLQIDKGSVARTLQQLERQGYILRIVSAEDKRQNLIYPTEKSKTAYPQITNTIDRWQEELTSNLSAIEIDILANLLDKVLANLEQ